MINRTPARDRLGALGVAERLVVPLKPGNAGGGKGPQFKTDARRSEDLEIGRPINSGQRSETADGVARESEGRTRLPLLRPLRLEGDLPADHWDHLRTSNPIESVFATVRHRTVRMKGALSQDTARLMVFKLVTAASRT